MYQTFEELNLTVTELPIEFEEEHPVYRGLIRELPFITGQGSSRKELYRNLAEVYDSYIERQTEPPEEMTSSLLSVDQLMKYYDGEVFDGFDLSNEKNS